MWLDFSEIPPAKPPSPDTEAFEKFAKQFFEEIYNGKIEKTAGRGSDGGADLIVQIGTDRCLVSCKHNLRSSVRGSAEKDPKGDMDVHGCNKFFGFYSGSPNNSLNRRLEGIRAHHPSFQFEILNGADIEAKLFSFANARGWLLAARWFPTSYAKIFSQLVHPLDHYGEKDLLMHDEAGKLWAGDVPIAFMYSPGSTVGREQAKRAALSIANEVATSEAFAGIFLNRVGEFAALFPGTFLKTKFIPEDEQTYATIYPSWDAEILREQVVDRHSLKTAFTICRVWSLWDSTYAVECMRAARMLSSIPAKSIPDRISTVRDVANLYDELHGSDASKTAFDYLARNVTLSEIGAECSTLERGYFAGLLCFIPGRLHRKPSRDRMAVWLAQHYGETEELKSRLEEIVPMLSQDDRLYVQGRSSTLHEFLVSIRHVDLLTEKYPSRIETGLRCYIENGLEPWIPQLRMSDELADILTGGMRTSSP